MTVSHAKSRPAPQRTSRNGIADTLVVAGILAFGYFAVTIETTRQQGLKSAAPATVESPLELLR